MSDVGRSPGSGDWSRLEPYRGPEDDPAAREDGWVASVAVIVRPGTGSDDSRELLLIQRADFDSDPWSGHIAFPGGRRESADASLMDTAIRETREETGLRLEAHGRPLGRLPIVEPETVRLPSLSILPLVFSVPRSLVARPVSDEVASVFWVSLGALLDPDARTTYRRRFEDRVISFPAIGVEGRVIWGLTRRILHDLLARTV